MLWVQQTVIGRTQAYALRNLSYMRERRSEVGEGKGWVWSPALLWNEKLDIVSPNPLKRQSRPWRPIGQRVVEADKVVVDDVESEVVPS